MKGKINREAIYELKENENLKEVIEIAGGLISHIYKKVQIDRIIPFEKRESTGYDKTIIDVDLTDLLSNDSNVELFDGDVIFRINLQEL